MLGISSKLGIRGTSLISPNTYTSLITSVTNNVDMHIVIPYPCLHIKYVCVVEEHPSSDTRNHHCSVVVNLGEGMVRHWRRLLSCGGLD